jgi:hypothetical protein
MDLSTVTKETFAPHQGTIFRVRARGADVDLVLIEVRAGRSRPSRPGIRPEPFSLLFRGAMASPLTQGLYPLEHPQLPGLELFIVPVGRDTEGLHYEAVFN